jgi:23S rRNA pseudouridine1911/1915/1917 synthase
MYTFDVDPQDEGERIDRWLAQQLQDHSRSEVQRWIRDGHVAVDGQPCRASQPVLPGQHIAVDPPAIPDSAKAAPRPIPLDIVYEDTNIVVVNKPAGMVVHPAPGHIDDTLVNAILYHCPDIQGIGGEMRPGIVHRLDKETSGLIVVAKNAHALRHLQAQFRARQVHKVYVALLEGQITPDSGRISVPLGRHPTHRKRQAAFPMQTSPTSGHIREAVTDYKVVARYFSRNTGGGGPGHFSLVTAEPRTGRTHQLRVHFAWMNHPIVGDSIYGYRKQRLPSPRLFLHARDLGFAAPSSDRQVEFHAPLPPDLCNVLDELSET